MKSLIFIISSFVCLYLALSTCGKGSGDTNLKVRILKLGNSTVCGDLKFLRSDPPGALPLLVDELRPISVGEMRPNANEKELHVIWCLRALRYLTGMKQYGEVQDLGKLVDEETAYWLKIDKSGIPFFSTKMSSDIVYVAPTNVQMQVIEKWEQVVNSKGYEIKSAADLKVWYF